jgi:Lrp/AsnC family leucine-responsive transcriptional regulator
MKLDKSTCTFLYHLDANARVGFSELAKRLGVSEGTVRYRYDTLVRSGIILSAYPVIDVGRLGMSVHKILFKLAGASERDTTSMLAHLTRHPSVNWVARFDGAFDLGCTVLVEHVGEVARFVDSFRARFYERIRYFSYAVNLQAEFFPRDYLVSEKRTKNTAAVYRSYSDSSEAKLDNETIVSARKIMTILGQDVRTSVAQIARTLAISPETVKKRLKRLEKTGLISGYRLALDHTRISRESYYLLVYVHPVAEKRLSTFVQFLRETPEVVYLIRMLGGWDFDVSLEVRDAVHYREFMGQLQRLFPDVVKDVQSLSTWQLVKFGILPTAVDVAAPRQP